MTPIVTPSNTPVFMLPQPFSCCVWLPSHTASLSTGLQGDIKALAITHGLS